MLVKKINKMKKMWYLKLVSIDKNGFARKHRLVFMYN